MSTSSSSPSSRSSSGVNFTCIGPRRPNTCTSVTGDCLETVVDVRRDLGGQQVVGVLGEHARDVEGDVAVADHGDLLCLERPGARHVRVAVVPAHEVGGAVAAREVDAGDAEVGVAHGAGREDHRVVVVLEVVQGDVLAEVHVAEDADVAAVEHLAQGGDDALDARVVRRDAVADQAVGRGQVLEQVDRDVELTRELEQDVGRVDAGRSGSDDREAQLGQREGVLCCEVTPVIRSRSSSTRPTGSPSSTEFDDRLREPR